MSFKAMAFATEQEITKTSPQSHLLLILASYANDNDECYPSVKTMAKKTRLNEKTVRKCIQELIELKLIIDTEKTTAFGAKIYKINFNINQATPTAKNGTPTKIGSTEFGSTPLPNLVAPPCQNWEYPPTEFGSTPLPNLVDNPIIEPIIEPVSVTAHTPVENLPEKKRQDENPTNKPTVDETFEFLKNSCVIPMFGNHQANEYEIGVLVAGVHSFWGEQLFRGNPLSKNQILGKILAEVKKIGSAQDILARLTVAPVAEAPVAEGKQPQQYRTLSNFEILAMKRQAKQGGQ